VPSLGSQGVVALELILPCTKAEVEDSMVIRKHFILLDIGNKTGGLVALKIGDIGLLLVFIGI
jgi:hypothetical protein